MDFAKLAKIPFTHTPCTGETSDGLGNSIPAYGTPSQSKAYSVGGPSRATQGSQTITETETVDIEVAMPKASVKPKDLFTFDGRDYEVVKVDDATFGFHRWKPGIVVGLRKA